MITPSIGHLSLTPCFPIAWRYLSIVNQWFYLRKLSHASVRNITYNLGIMFAARHLAQNLRRANEVGTWKCCGRRLFSDVNKTEEETKRSGYARAFEKFEHINEPTKEEPQTFAALLRHSKFVDLGDPAGKIVFGRIFHIIDDDLYIDFGWKFHCVCPRPKKLASSYVRGAKVRLLIKELELSSKFLGYEKDLTLLEANCFLLGLQQDGGAQTHNNA